MNQRERAILLAAIRGWVDRHPSPDTPIVEIARGQLLPSVEQSGGGLSPRQIYNELQENSELGQWLTRVIDAGIARANLDDVLKGFGQ